TPGRQPCIMDWNFGFVVACKFPEGTVLSPAATAHVLPYIDESVNIVAVASWDFVSRAEAQRVAKAAVMKVSPAQDRAGQEPSIEIEWKFSATPVEETLTSSIVIPCCTNVAATKTCLVAAMETLPQNFNGEVIIVDAALTDEFPGGLESLAKSDRRVKIARSQEVKGFLAACNCGAKAAMGDILIFLNPAVVPLAGWFPPLLQIFRDYPK